MANDAGHRRSAHGRSRAFEERLNGGDGRFAHQRTEGANGGGANVVVFVVETGFDQVDVDGDEASAFAYLDARYGQDGQSLIVAARYDEKYRRTAQGWRISWTYIDVIFSVPVQLGWADPSDDYFSKIDLPNT